MMLTRPPGPLPPCSMPEGPRKISIRSIPNGLIFQVANPKDAVQTVEKRSHILRVEPANLEPVVACISAERLGAHAGYVAQRFGNIGRLLIADLLGADNRNG